MMKANNSIIRFCMEDRAAILFRQKLVNGSLIEIYMFMSVGSHENAEYSMAVAN